MAAFLDRHFMTIGVLILLGVLVFINVYPLIAIALIYPVAFAVAWKSLKRDIDAELPGKPKSLQFISLFFHAAIGAAMASAAIVAVIMGISGVLLSGGGGSGPEMCIPRGPCY